MSKYDILQWPVLQHDANGRLLSASYAGDFVLRADVKWKFIDILPDKSQLTSEPQGEYPSQTQLNKLVAVHPGVDLEASGASAYLNNNDNVFLVEDMRGAIRVVGSDKWSTKTTVNQDLGQGAAGTTSTTINVEATDECPAPFYAGKILTDDGTINPNGNPNQNTGGGSVNTGGGGSSSTPVYNSTVRINNTNYSPSVGGNISIYGPLAYMSFTGSNMSGLKIQEEGELAENVTISNGTSASWEGNIPGPATVNVLRYNGSSTVIWFTITVMQGPSTGPDDDEPDEN